MKITTTTTTTNHDNASVLLSHLIWFAEVLQTLMNFATDTYVYIKDLQNMWYGRSVLS